MKPDTLISLAMIAAGIWLWQKLKNPPAPVQAGEQWIANLWVTLTSDASVSSMFSPGTNVQWPDGTETSVTQLPIRIDSNHNIYTNKAGVTYQLQPWVMDNTGNPVWPAVAVGS